MKTYILPKELKKELRKVWGIPIFGKKKEVSKKFADIIEKKKFKTIITVGDYCSIALPSDIRIFDGRIKRKVIRLPPKFGDGAFRVSNPAGTIQPGVWPTLKRAIKKNKNIFVEGEEDLLAIPAVLLSQKNTAVIYGLPEKGICLIVVTPTIKKELKELLKRFLIK